MSNKVKDIEASIRDVEETPKYKGINTSTTTHTLPGALKQLNANQRKSVRERGFGHLLDLELGDTPPKLAYWLVQSFDSRSFYLRLPGGKELDVIDQDVALALGIPLGHQTIQKRRK